MYLTYCIVQMNKLALLASHYLQYYFCGPGGEIWIPSEY